MSAQASGATQDANQPLNHEDDQIFIIMGCASMCVLFVTCVCCIKKLHRETILGIITVSISRPMQVYILINCSNCVKLISFD